METYSVIHINKLNLAYDNAERALANLLQADETVSHSYGDIVKAVVYEWLSVFPLTQERQLVNTPKELEALPIGTVFMDKSDDFVYQIISNGEPGIDGRVIVCAGIEDEYHPVELDYPLTVLNTPQVKDESNDHDDRYSGNAYHQGAP